MLEHVLYIEYTDWTRLQNVNRTRIIHWVDWQWTSLQNIARTRIIPWVDWQWTNLQNGVRTRIIPWVEWQWYNYDDFLSSILFSTKTQLTHFYLNQNINVVHLKYWKYYFNSIRMFYFQNVIIHSTFGARLERVRSVVTLNS